MVSKGNFEITACCKNIMLDKTSEMMTHKTSLQRNTVLFMKSHLLLGGRPSVSGRSCNKRMVVHCDDKLSRGNADFGRILVRFYSFVCQGCDSFCVGFFLISESCILVHHGKIVQGAYGLITQGPQRIYTRQNPFKQPHLTKTCFAHLFYNFTCTSFYHTS